MKKIVSKRFSMVCLLALSIAFGGCKDVIEQDITKKEVSINSPKNGAQSTVYNQLFWWNLLEGATQYSIQIASPSFDSIQNIVADTIVTTDKFYKTLAPGNYQWRIRAENGAYKTNYQTYALRMLLSSLSSQSVILKAPLDNDCQNTNSFSFDWDDVPGAIQYTIEIDSSTGNFVNPMLTTTVTTSNYNNSTTIIKQGSYIWRVMAKDSSGGHTPYSGAFNFCFNLVPPAVPVPASPVNTYSIASAAASSTGVPFTWNTVSKATSYTIYLYTDSSGTSPVSIQNFNVLAPATSKTYQITNATPGKMFWKISATDNAGNESARSAPFKIITIVP